MAAQPSLATLRKGNFGVRLGEEMNRCYTCQSCLAECPVNKFTNRLHPMALVRMVRYGLYDELMRLAEIWYCISCHHCSRVCPMNVKPASLISFLQQLSINENGLSRQVIETWKDLQRYLQRARWNAAVWCLKDEPLPDPDSQWNLYTRFPDNSTDGNGKKGLIPIDAYQVRKDFKKFLGYSINFQTCLTCAECFNACPIAFERQVFDPMQLIREVVMGFGHQVLLSPSIWLCIRCERCTYACKQDVKGHLLMRRLQELAFSQGIVDQSFFIRWGKAQELIFSHFLDKVDNLLLGDGIQSVLA